MHATERLLRKSDLLHFIACHPGCTGRNATAAVATDPCCEPVARDLGHRIAQRLRARRITPTYAAQLDLAYWPTNPTIH